MKQFGMTEADVLALALGGPAEHFSVPDEVYVGGRRVPRQRLPRLKKSAASTVHTVKASLHGAKPPVWRRLELPSGLPLDMVHEVMQIAFAWHGYHLHQFETACGTFGRPDDDGDWGFEEVGDESALALAQVAAEEKAKIVYVYDFGDDWRHDIVATAWTCSSTSSLRRRMRHRREAAAEALVWPFRAGMQRLGDTRRPTTSRELCYCESVKNITVSVPDEVYRNARIAAAQRDTSLSALVTDYLERLSGRMDEFARLEALQHEVQAEIAQFRAADRLSRDEVHDRAVR